MQVSEVRQKFLQYFAAQGHTIVKSSSLIPNDDPTLLFTNAGMNQFKDVFLGLEQRDYVRAVSSQKCVRAGGKHNDLENVGYTARHHTFFEMLGNFSFGDYFKLQAIKYAWEFLTQVLQLPPQKLYVTVYETDDEAYAIWQQEIGLSPDKIIRIGDKAEGGSDNFWQMGDTGPCGPCTEIFYDHGPLIPGGLPGSVNEGGDRYIEIWNCVFMQFNRDESGKLHPLPKPSVDTGMGLERIAAVMQQVHSNYAIDLFVSLIREAANITQCKDLNNPSLKVLADHIRSVAFLIADGVIPANEGRGYVLRRIIRRAIRHGYKLGMRVAFLFRLVKELVVQMGDAYPELILKQEIIEQTILQEEEKFLQTIANGMGLLEHELTCLSGKVLAGEIAFKLYDTYGFPFDLTQDICREIEVKVDEAGFNQAMAKQKSQAKATGKFKMDARLDYVGSQTKFVGYTKQSVSSKVVALYHNNQPVTKLSNNQEGVVVLNQTVFYAESGGQIGDCGILQKDGGSSALFTINDTQKIRSQVIGHIGKLVNGQIQVGDEVVATFDLHKRLATARNHSATHLLHKALHAVLGSHAVQKGSLVTNNYIRLDFAHNKAVTPMEIQEVERIVNHVIQMNYEVIIEDMPYLEALKQGAIALFGEKYTDLVRVIKMGEFSIELCGGTHVKRTGDIGLFIIISEAGIATGVRRIEAISGEVALAWLQKNRAILTELKDRLKAHSNEDIIEKVATLSNENKKLNKELVQLQTNLTSFQLSNWLNQTETLANGLKLLVVNLANMENKALLEVVNKLKDKLISGIIIVGCTNTAKVNLVVGVTKDLVSRYHAGVIANHLATLVGGKGGGRPDLAQAGGVEVNKLAATLAQAKNFIQSIS